MFILLHTGWYKNMRFTYKKMGVSGIKVIEVKPK